MTFKRRKSKKTIETKKMGKIKHIKTEVDGIKFDSKMESDYYKYLKDLKEQGIVKDFSLQPEFILQEKFIVVNGQTILGSHPDFLKIKRKNKALTVQAIKYISDFKVEYTDGHTEIVDPKGQETADFKLKKKMFMYKYPHLIFKVIIFDGKEQKWIDFDEYKKKEREKKNIRKMKKSEA